MRGKFWESKTPQQSFVDLAGYFGAAGQKILKNTISASWLLARDATNQNLKNDLNTSKTNFNLKKERRMSTRIYVVTETKTNEKKLVQAPSQWQAIRQCVNGMFDVKAANAKDVADHLMGGGIITGMTPAPAEQQATQ